MTLPTISKTTLNGYLEVGMIICLGLTTAHGVPLAVSGGAGTILAVLRVISGHLQGDAEQTEALVPGNPIPQVVPAHPVPDNPADVPVVKPQ